MMPLSGKGLWEAEIMTPSSMSWVAVRWAIAGVGRTPTRVTSMPEEARPALMAWSRNSPEARVSRPTMARGRPLRELRAADVSLVRTRAAASPSCTARVGVSRSLARPRTPSVPKRRAMEILLKGDETAPSCHGAPNIGAQPSASAQGLMSCPDPGPAARA